MLEALRQPDDHRLRAYAQEQGQPPFILMERAFNSAYDCVDLERFQKSESVLNGPHELLLTVLATEFREHCYLDAFHTIAALGSADRLRVRRQMQEVAIAAASESPVRAIERVHQAMQVFDELHFLHGTAKAREALATLYSRVGDGRRSRYYYRSALDDYRRVGNIRFVCQFLGGVGSAYHTNGQIDSMRVCYDEALRIAIENRHPEQAPRLLNFYANFYRREGRTALAHEMLRASIAVSEEYKAGGWERRFLVELAEFYQSLGHWDAALRLIDRATLRPAFMSCVDDDMAMVPLVWAQILRARILMDMGRVEEANRLFEQAGRAPYYTVAPNERVRLQLRWAEGLINNGRPKEALPIIEAGLSRDVLVDQLMLQQARAAYQLGDLRACEMALDRFEGEVEPAHQSERIMHDSMRIDLSLARGDIAAAWNYAASGFSRLQRYFAGIDASVDGYLTVGSLDRIRTSLHRLVSENPSLAYGAALYWISLHRSLGGGSASTDAAIAITGNDSRDLVTRRFMGLSGPCRAAVVRADACHLTYAVLGDEVWRWTVSRSGITQDSLAIDVQSLRALVAEASKVVTAGSVKGGPGVLAPLERLSEILLPASVRAGGTALSTPVLITADGFLGAFPFETLSVDSAVYTPLLARHDVAYLRPGVVHAGPTAAEATVFLGPDTPGTLKTRYPFQPTLRAAAVEAGAVKSLLPAARILSGASATKRALTSQWERSGLIYVVGHVIHDPEAPYLVMLPAASPSPGAAIEECYIDVRDVRAADLSRCELAVLSGCSSGLPYAKYGAVAPSLAQVFMDAGARSVVHTFWDIGDQQACDLMTDFMRRRQAGVPVVHALGETRRERMRATGEAVASFDWCAYGVTISSADMGAK